VDLAALHARYPHELSGGQQQRVPLARALAPEPAMLLLDEPFSNLDAALRRHVRQEVLSILRSSRVAAIFVTHDQSEAMSLADQVAVMQAGRLLQLGPPRDVYRHPASRDAANLLGEANWIPGDAHGDAMASALGPLDLATPHQGPVEALVRPEAVIITSDDTGNARVVQTEFLGHEQIITIVLPDGYELRVRHHPFDAFLPGSSVTLSVREPVVAFPAA
jgi:iron(III) transport system ATP-binding protein